MTKILWSLASMTTAAALAAACGGGGGGSSAGGTGGDGSGGTGADDGSGGAETSTGGSDTGGDGGGDMGGASMGGANMGGADTGGTTSSGGSATGGEGGAIEPELACGGTATSCDTFEDSLTCAGQDGCGTSGICTGDDVSCGDHVDADACTAGGCSWMMPCQPDTACSTYTTSSPCNLDQGCEWDVSVNECVVKESGGCVDVLDEASCTVIVGCSWHDAYFSCGGTATECSEFDTTACLDQDGCVVE